MKIKKWYVVVEYVDGEVEHLYGGDLPSFMTHDMEQYTKEIETYRNEIEQARNEEAV